MPAHDHDSASVVATWPSTFAVGSPRTVAAELVVFDFPAFIAKYTAKVRHPDNGFTELAWAADSKSLYVIDGPVNNATTKAVVRRLDVPAFAERPVERTLALKGDAALISSVARVMRRSSSSNQRVHVSIRRPEIKQNEWPGGERIDDQILELPTP
jgi:hypothetical protein